jgi:hypothetical protein
LPLGAANAETENCGNAETAAAAGSRVVVLMKSRLFMAAPSQWIDF